MKYYYENLVANQNIIAKTNVAWIADIISQKIIKSLEKSIKERINPIDKNKLIIHTDRETQFSSKAYNTFVIRCSEYLYPSIARENTPTDNSVAERFMRTFKEHNFRSYRSVLNEYTYSLKGKPNKKSRTSPRKHDLDVILT